MYIDPKIDKTLLTYLLYLLPKNVISTMKFPENSSENFAQLRRLQIQENLQIKNVLQSVKSMKNKNVENFVLELESQRYEDFQPLTEMFNTLKITYEDLTMNVSSKEKIRSLDVEYYKNQMKYLQSQITKINHVISDQLSSLKKNALEIHQDNILPLPESSKSLKIFSGSSRSSPSISITNVQHERYDDIGVFQKFIGKTGGHTGGWGIKEHVIFSFTLRKWSIDNTTTMTEKCILEIVAKIPGITVEEILAHKIWWDKYCTLKNKHAKALQNWKSEKDEEQTADKKLHVSAKKNSALLEKITDYEKKMHSEQIKTKIDQWKISMDEKKAQEIKCKMEKHFGKRKNVIKRKRINKEAVAKWLQKRKSSVNITFIPDRPEPKETIKQNKDFKKINYFRKRDEQITKKRVKLINKALESKIDKRKEIITVNIRSQYDMSGIKSKYLQPTEQWSRRTLKIDKNEHNYIINDPESIPKLRIPDWRNGITIR